MHILRREDYPGYGHQDEGATLVSVHHGVQEDPLG